MSDPTISKSVQELEIDDGELRIARQRLGAEKQSLQGEIVKLNAKCNVKLPTIEFVSIQNERSKIVSRLSEIEAQIANINAQRAELTTVLEVRKSQSMNRHDIRKLVEIRDEWHGFSMDKVNHQKAREVAWKISQEIGEVLKRYFDSSANHH